MIAQEFAAANASAIEDWANAGAPYFSELVERHGLSSLIRSIADVAPITRHEVLRMFAPRDDELPSSKSVFLDLHYDAWLRAAVPVQLPPPIGSLLHHLLQTHNMDADVSSDRMNYGNLVQAFAQVPA
jgi:hypothetical protein